MRENVDEAVKLLQEWDHEDINDLMDLINDAETELKNEGLEPSWFIDMCDLPSEPIPDDVDTGYPVWAMDKQGYCLVGDDATSTAHLDEIRENCKYSRLMNAIYQHVTDADGKTWRHWSNGDMFFKCPYCDFNYNSSGYVLVGPFENVIREHYEAHVETE
jgi:hypothetical protein